MPNMTGSVSQTMVAGCLFCLALFSQSVAASESRDATIHGCIAATQDRWWAVGERGQVLLSEDAGRTWNSAVVDGSPNFYAGIAVDERTGVIVGGTIQPYSYRSVGAVQITRDGGRRWRTLACEGLPRLTGIQRLSPQHWIAWGDWSPTFHSAIFETIDGGASWQGKPIAASHVQTAAWKDSYSGIVVDRLGRVFRFGPAGPPVLLSIGSDASNPILKAVYHESGWWLVGESGQIYHSLDGLRWEPKRLPGTATDHQLLRLNDIALQTVSVQSGSGPQQSRTRCWIVGVPGSVVWSSDDLGATWQTQPTSQSMPLQSITRAGSDTVFAGGQLATIVGTRNAGEGWWILGQQGDRVSLLSIAANQASIPWDALAMTSKESRAHASAVVLHGEKTYERAGPWCESATRAAVLAGELEIANLDTLYQRPVVGSFELSTKWDLAASRTKSQGQGDPFIELKTVLLIRQNKPDVLICDSFDSQDSLVQATGRMVMTARNRASDSGFSCFSKESGIPDNSWDCKTLLARSIPEDQSSRRRSELRLAPTTPIHREGKLLSEALLAVGAITGDENLLDPKSITFAVSAQSLPPWTRYAEYSTIFGVRPAGGKNGLLPSTIRQSGAMRTKSITDAARYQTTLTNLQRESMLKNIVSLEVEESTQDSRWRSTLYQFIHTSSSESRSHSLWYLAQESRRKSQWSRWSMCLDSLVGEYPNDGAAELAAIQRAAWGKSQEVQTWRNRKSPDQQSPEVVSRVVTANAASSPFDLRFEGPASPNQTSSLIQTSKIGESTRQPSRSTLKSQSVSKIISPVQTASHQVTFNTKPTSKVAGNDPLAVPFTLRSAASSNIEFDPRNVLLGLPRAGASNASDLANLHATIKKMADWHGIYGWSTLAEEEYSIRFDATAASRDSGPQTSMKQAPTDASVGFPSSMSQISVPMTTSRPILDGSLSDEVWRYAYKRPLVSLEETISLQTSSTNISTVYLIRDKRFLYVAGSCKTQRGPAGLNAPAIAANNRTATGTRTHDQPELGADSFSLKIDTDRDFLTWFQFTIDSNGNLTDSLNDIESWNPRWYAATAQSESSWEFELAIPLAELSNEDWVDHVSSEDSMKGRTVVWNITMSRVAAGRTAQKSKPSIGDDHSPLSWLPTFIAK